MRVSGAWVACRIRRDLSQPKQGEDRQDDDDGTDEIDNAVHGRVLWRSEGYEEDTAAFNLWLRVFAMSAARVSSPVAGFERDGSRMGKVRE